MRITVLTFVEDPKQPEDVDVVVPQVVEALERKGHKVSVLAVHDDTKGLIAGLEEQKPELVFNLLEEFGTNPRGNIYACGLLAMLGYRFTGCGPGDYYLGQDKVLAKKLLAFEEIMTPKFAVFTLDKMFETGGNLRLPMFVKPVAMDASIGIGKKSLVTDSAALLKRVQQIHKEVGDSALCEEYIDGREIFVGVIGNREAMALPPVEVDFSGLPAGAPKILGQAAKFDVDSVEYKGTKTELASVPDELRAKLQRVSLEAYRALRVKDYGRVDLRVTDEGEIYVLEVNASCYLEKDGEFAMAAQAAGIGYDDLVDRIVKVTTERYAELKTPV